MLVEDEAIVAKYLKMELEEEGYLVLDYIPTGESAVEKAGSHKPDVVLMDAFMPKMNGLEATRIIKKRWRNIRVVILTLHDDIREEAIAAGADAFLVKGCSPDDLILEIKNERRWNNDI